MEFDISTFNTNPNQVFYQPQNPVENNNNNNNNNDNNNNKEKRPNKKIKLENNEFDFQNFEFMEKYPNGDLIDNNFLGETISTKISQSYIDLIINPSENTNAENALNMATTQDMMSNAEFYLPIDHDIPIESGRMEPIKDFSIQIYEPILDRIKKELYQFEMEINLIYEQSKKRIYPKKKTIMEFKEKIENLCAEIHYLLQKKILHVVNVYYSQWLLQQLYICSKRLTLVNNEIEYFEEKMSKNDAVDILTSFVFIDQPLSQSFKNKNRARQVNTKKKSHCIMKAAILTSPNSYFRFTKPVMAQFTTKEDTSSKPDITLESSTEEMGKNIIVISFSFRFPVGTRCKPAQLKLEVEGDAYLPQVNGKFTTTIKSEPSNNFVVATNECQWEGAEGKLLMYDLFGEDYVSTQKGNKRKKKKSSKDQKEATWPFFINQLSIRFIRATRQEMSINDMIKKLECGEMDSIFKRVLIENDINYLHEKRFNNNMTVTPQQVEVFFDWYGKSLHIFRHNSHIRSIFLEGLFFSLISKESSEQLLQNQRPGTFLIRTSERSTKGEFALAFVTENNRIKHTKIEMQKIQPPHSSLPDHIKDIQQLQFVIKPPTIVGCNDFQVIPKDVAFSCFYTKRVKDQEDGYDEIAENN